jgi:hypothetical protein
MKERTRANSFERRGLEDWESWWKALQAEPFLKELFARCDLAEYGKPRAHGGAVTRPAASRP